MARLLKAKRLPNRDEIEWLTHDQRAEFRRTLKYFTTIIDCLERNERLPDKDEAFLQQFTGSGNPETWYNAAIHALEKTEESYYGKLAKMAPLDLTAYHEFMNPLEVPAKHHIWLCEKLMAVERGDIRTLLLSLNPGAAKALALDTPIPTPTGWTTMGALRVGDTVFDENGKPCNVTWVSPVWKNRPVYEVTTDCGDTIIADELHEWPICSDRSTGEYENTETRHIRPRCGKKPRIQRAKALILPDAALPIDPYLLGVWLGDGTSSSLSITSSVEDQPWLRAELASLGYKTKTRDTVPTLFHVYGVRAKFVALGLINDPAHSTFGRKHVPEIYMRASPSQRLSLLQGLMDTDGTVCKRSGAATFCNTNKELALSVRELARSLGVKAGWSEGRAILNGADHGPVYRVCVYHAEAMRMPRKRALCKAGTRTPNTYIDVEPAGFADTICITVDSPSHLFLAGRAMTPTHNSSYGSRSFVQWCMGRNPDWCVLGAGHGEKFAINEFSKPNRDAINTDNYRAVFPDIMLSETDKAADYWKLDGFRGKYYAKGVGSGIAGIRAKLTNIDDPLKSAEDAASAVIRDKQWRWITADVMSRRLPDARLCVIACMTGDTPVTMADGSWKDLSDIRPGDYVLSKQGDAHVPARVLNWIDQGEDDVIEISTGNSVVRANARHPFLGRVCRHYDPKTGKANGWGDVTWIKAGDIKKGDKVVLQNLVDLSEPARLTLDEAKLLGIAFGDGYVSRYSPKSKNGGARKFTQKQIRFALSRDDDENKVIFNLFKRVFGYELNEYIYDGNGGRSSRAHYYASPISEHADWFDERGVSYGKTAHTKRIPQWLFSQPRDVRQSFVDGFVFADGHEAASGQISVGLCNRTLVKDLQQLVRSLGYRTSKVRHYHDTAVPLPSGRCVSRDRYVVAWTRNTRTMDAFIERNVVSVKPAGRAVVYDIQVEGTELFYADGYVVHNTRWQSEDIIGRMEALHKANPKALFGPVEIINLPAQAKDDDPIGRRPGEWLWEEFYGAQHYESLRLTMPAGEWSALYMGEPLDKFGEHVAEDDFMRYDAYPKPDDTQKVIISVDTAQKATKRSNPTAITVYKRGVDKVHYLVYACKVKSKMEQVIKLLSRLATIWGANYILIEDAGFGSQILQNYQGKLPAPLVEFSPHSKNSKEFQFENAVPYITTGAVRFPKQAPWLSGFINELVAFPSGSEDDYCDSFSQYISHEVRTFRGGTKSMKVVG